MEFFDIGHLLLSKQNGLIQMTKPRYLQNYFTHSSDNSSAKNSLEHAFDSVAEHMDKLEKRIESLEKPRHPGGDKARSR